MVFLALISGFINLSSQVMYQKVVSMLVGDLYTVFVAVTLAFIIGAAIGSYIGHYFRKSLPLLELGIGIYNLILFALLQRALYDVTIPLPLVLLGLFLPALALGTHIPLYSYYFRKHRFSLVFALYHLGGALGLLALEWHFINAGSVSVSVLILGCIQSVLGLCLFGLRHRKSFEVDSSTHAIPLSDWKSRVVFKSIACVFLACTISFYNISWAVKTQLMLTETFRLHATCISIAVFFWMTLAGSVRKKVNLSSSVLFLGMALSFLIIAVSFPILTPKLSSINNGSLLLYYQTSVLLAVFLSIPVFFSSLIFIRETETLSKHWSVDVSSGILNLFAGLGSFTGLLLVYPFAPWFWDRTYFLIAVAASGVCSIIFSKKKKSALALSITSLAAFLFIPPIKTSIAEQRFPKHLKHCLQTSDFKTFSHPQASVALLYADPTKNSECFNTESALWYIVDGHQSHNLLRGDEIFVGAAAGMYFPAPVKKSLVIGVGSGQSAFGASTISKKVDLVEISPIVISNLEIIKEHNHDLLSKENVSFILRDGFNFVRECEAGSYDIILNTSTYPSSFNAAKLYSDEFIELALRCLSPEGVYHTYFDSSSAMSSDDIYQFLAPIARHFKFIDILQDPYPQVFAYNSPRSPHFLSDRNFQNKKDRSLVLQTMQNALQLEASPIAYSNRCVEFYPAISFENMTAAPLNTLDKSFLEKNSIRNIVRIIYEEEPASPNILESTFSKQKRCLNSLQ